MSFLRALMPNTAKLFKEKKSTPVVPTEPVIKISETDSDSNEDDKASINKPPPKNETGDTATNLKVEEGSFQHFKGPGSCSTQTTVQVQPLPCESGDNHPQIPHPVHYESFYQPTVYQRCWTIRDFITVSKYPKMLKPYKLLFDDAVPPVEFRIKLNRSGILSLRPVMPKEAVKEWGSTFVKYGFSLGPHHSMGEDFTLYSPVLQIKNLNKTHLDVFESKRIIHSYLVDGNLNLIVRFTPFSPKTQPVQGGALNNRNEDALVESCSQFSFSKKQESLEKYLASEFDDDEDTSSESSNDDLMWDVGTKDQCSENEPNRLREAIRTSEILTEENVTQDIEDDENVEYLLSESCLHHAQIRSKPCRRSRKSEFIRQKKQLWSHTASSPLLMYKMPYPRSVKLNQTL